MRSLKAFAANEVEGKGGLQIVWTISPWRQFIRGAPTIRLSDAKAVDKYLSTLLNKSKDIYLAQLQADRVPPQGAGSLSHSWGVQVRSLSTTGGPMSFELQKRGTALAYLWTGIPGMGTGSSQSFAPKALANLLYYTKNVA